MKEKNKWITLSALIVIICSFTFFKGYDEIILMLETIAHKMRYFAVIIHILSILLLLSGIIMKRFRNQLIAVFLLFVSLTATITGIKYMVPPNILIFTIFFALTFTAFRKGELVFHFKKVKSLDKFIGIMSLFFAFYYLHWVESPLYLNALIYSPMGILNCPTMLAFCGLLCFIDKKGSKYLEVFAGSITLFFGFLGTLCLGAYIDIVLIISGQFLLIRSASKLNSNDFY